MYLFYQQHDLLNIQITRNILKPELGPRNNFSDTATKRQFCTAHQGWEFAHSLILFELNERL